MAVGIIGAITSSESAGPLDNKAISQPLVNKLLEPGITNGKELGSVIENGRSRFPIAGS
jgi:hypothetical protein